MRKSLILLAAVRVLVPLLLLYSVFLLWRGHNAPGGGFVAGLIAAAAIVLYALTSGVAAGRRLLPVNPLSLLSTGLGVALLSGTPALMFGRPFMSAVWTEIEVGPIHLYLGTPLLFDVGVFLAVLGVILTIILTLAETSLAKN